MKFGFIKWLLDFIVPDLRRLDDEKPVYHVDDFHDYKPVTQSGDTQFFNQPYPHNNMTVFAKAGGAILLAAIGVLEGLFLGKIKDITVKNALTANLAPFRPMVLAVTDDNPRNGEQLQEILQQHLNQNVPGWVDSERVRLINQLDDDNTKMIVLALTYPSADLLRLISDGNPDNKSQVKDYLAQYFQRDDVRDVAFDNIFIPQIEKIKDESTRILFLEMVKALRETV